MTSMIKQGLCAILFLCGSTYALPDTHPLTDLTKPLILSNHSKTVEICLKSNKTTGFSWFLSDYDANFLTPTQHTYLPPSNQKLMGAPGIEVFTFQLKPALYTVPQTGKIKFVYKRPWDSATQTETTVEWMSSRS